MGTACRCPSACRAPGFPDCGEGACRSHAALIADIGGLWVGCEQDSIPSCRLCCLTASCQCDGPEMMWIKLSIINQMLTQVGHFWVLRRNHQALICRWGILRASADGKKQSLACVKWYPSGLKGNKSDYIDTVLQSSWNFFVSLCLKSLYASLLPPVQSAYHHVSL